MKELQEARRFLFVADVSAEVQKARVDVPDCGQGEAGELLARRGRSER